MRARTDGPTVVIGGAQKSATTTLFRWLGEHPDVGAPTNKEPLFFAFPDGSRRWTGPGADEFARTIVSDEAAYRGLFAGMRDRRHRIEGSTLYLSEPGVPERLMAFDPSIKVVFVLRDPADRVRSAFDYLRLRGFEPLASVLAAVDAEEGRRRAGWPPYFGYLDLSSYGDHLERWFAVVPRQQILCLAHHDLADRPREVLADVERFLELSPYDGYPVGTRHNASGEPRSRALQRLLDVRFPFRSRLRTAAPRLHAGVLALRNRNLARGSLSASERSALLERLLPQVDKARRFLGPAVTAGWDA